MDQEAQNTKKEIPDESDLQENPENNDIGKKGTFEKIGGSQKFRKIMIFEETGTCEKIGPTSRS